MTSLVWLRRDLRVRDNPVLVEALADGGDAVVLFVLDPALWDGAGPARRAWLAATLRSLDERLDGRLEVRYGDPAEVVPARAREHGATEVHVTGEVTPWGRRRDRAVAEALAGRDVAWRPWGTPYAVAPGTVLTGGGTAYQVFTPFARAWREHGRPDPAPTPSLDRLAGGEDDGRVARLLDAASAEAPAGMPEAGEEAAWRRWAHFRDELLDDYATDRDRADLDGTSRLSPHLHLGVLHPRSLLAGLADRDGAGPQTYVTELAWREFYADVLWHRPDSAWADLKPLRVAYDEHPPGEDSALASWRAGTTGYPLVDAGMRQLLHEGWMHNRVRMVAASFLTKDLHTWWPVGARHFLDHLVDGDVASNNHGWQWVAGTGTDASPYFRVFNPVTQGKRFDPDGAYVRRWVPELAHLAGRAAHEPWRHPDGYDHGYPVRIVDHAEARLEALARYEAR